MGSFALESCLCEVSRLVLRSLAIETSQWATVSGRDRSDGYLGGIIFHAAGQSDRYDHGPRLITNWLIQKLKLGWPKWCQIWVVAWLLRDFGFRFEHFILWPFQTAANPDIGRGKAAYWVSIVSKVLLSCLNNVAHVLGLSGEEMCDSQGMAWVRGRVILARPLFEPLYWKITLQ